MNNAVPLSHATRELFLLQVHHPDNLGYRGSLPGLWRIIIGRIEYFSLGRIDAQLGKKVPANTLDIGQAQLTAKAVIEHTPEPLLKRLRVGTLRYFILADQQMRR